MGNFAGRLQSGVILLNLRICQGVFVQICEISNFELLQNSISQPS